MRGAPPGIRDPWVATHVLAHRQEVVLVDSVRQHPVGDDQTGGSPVVAGDINGGERFVDHAEPEALHLTMLGEPAPAVAGIGADLMTVVRIAGNQPDRHDRGPTQNGQVVHGRGRSPGQMHCRGSGEPDRDRSEPELLPSVGGCPLSGGDKRRPAQPQQFSGFQ